MTKEITKAYILQQITDKFKLREFDTTPFLLDETVVPVYNIEQHLTQWCVERSTVSITSATTFVFFTVPENEEWILRAYQVIFGMTGAIKGSGLHVEGRPGAADYIYLDLKKGQEVSYLVNLPVPVTLQTGENLRYTIDTYVSTQNLSIDIDVQKEIIR